MRTAELKGEEADPLKQPGTDAGGWSVDVIEWSCSCFFRQCMGEN